MELSKQIAYERDSGGMCVICGEKTTDRRRGLCIKHYEQYRRAKIGMSEDQIESFDAVLIETGKLMPSIQGKKSQAENVFSIIASEVMHGKKVAEKKPKYTTAKAIRKAKLPAANIKKPKA